MSFDRGAKNSLFSKSAGKLDCYMQKNKIKSSWKSTQNRLEFNTREESIKEENIRDASIYWSVQEILGKE